LKFTKAWSGITITWSAMGYSPSTGAITTVWFGAIVSILLILVGELGSVETLAYIGIWGCVVGLVMVLYALVSVNIGPDSIL